MLNHNIAAKALIVNNEGEILVLKRRPTDVHDPGKWDFPGGRLDEGESPFEALKRECVEETGLDVEVLNPLRVNHFTRQDGQLITLIIFMCTMVDSSQEVVLSEEHTEYKWLPPTEARETIHEAFYTSIDNYTKYFLGK